MPRKSSSSTVDATQRLLQHLQMLPESDLTHQIVQPLIQSLGYESIHYHGGPFEGGKDLICWKTNRLGDVELAVVQVKKLKLTSRARSLLSFSEVITQLSQASEQPVPHISGSTFLPNAIFFITPFGINTRTLTSRFERYKELRSNRIRVIDGPELVRLVFDLLPHVAREILGPQLELNTFASQQLTNKVLLSALHEASAKHVKDFFVDIDFSLGRSSTRMLFDAKLVACNVAKRLSLNDWTDFRRTCVFIRTAFQVEILLRPDSTIDDELQSTIREFDRQATEREQLQISLSDSLAALARQLDTSLLSLSKASEVETKQVALDKAQAERENSVTAHGWHLLETLKAESIKRATASYVQTTQLYLAETRQDDPARTWELARILTDWCNDAMPVPFVSGAQERLRAMNTLMSQIAKMRGYVTRIPHELTAEAPPMQTDSGLERPILVIETGTLSSVEWDQLIRISGAELSCAELAAAAMELQRLAEEYWTNRDQLGTDPEEPTVLVELEGRHLMRVLRNERSLISRTLRQFRSTPPSTDTLRMFLRTCNCLFEQIHILAASSLVCKLIGLGSSTKRRTKKREWRLNLPVGRILETGFNICVLGEAGAGKTTSLQMYASTLLQNSGVHGLTLFVPLAQVAHALRDGTASIDTSAREIASPCAEADRRDTEVPRLEEVLSRFFRAKGIGISETEIDAALAKSGTLLLDGIDEIISEFEWIGTSIRSFALRFPNVHVVVSSRMYGAYVEHLPFLPITLLPFSDEQRRAFFSRWFSGPDLNRHTKHIERHLAKHEGLRAVVSNPLAATILCTLEERGIDLPETECRLYEERMRLLLGYYYDARKQITRLTSASHDLERVARRTAFRLQSEQKREESRSWLVRVAEDALGGRTADARHAINELIDPCNILVPSEVGHWGFGHLRYQEYLAALELASNRSIDPLPFIGLSWWYGVFVLLGQLQGDLEWLIAGLSEKRLLNKHIGFVRAIISAVSPSMQKRMNGALNLLGFHDEDDSLDDEEEHQYKSDDDEFEDRFEIIENDVDRYGEWQLGHDPESDNEDNEDWMNVDD